MKLAIYNENCVMAGRQVSQSTLDAYDGDWRQGGDWTVYDGPHADLLALSETLPHSRRREYDEFYWRVSGTIREAVFSDRPDLRH